MGGPESNTEQFVSIITAIVIRGTSHSNRAGKLAVYVADLYCFTGYRLFDAQIYGFGQSSLAISIVDRIRRDVNIV